MTWKTLDPAGVHNHAATGSPAVSREQILERALRTVLNDGCVVENDDCWVSGERRGDIGAWTGARGFIRASELKPWDQLALDF